MRVALIAVLAVATATGLTARAAPHEVSCSTIIGHAASGHAGKRRVVLGVVAAPPAYLPQTVPTDRGPWRFWKTGLVVHANAGPVTVRVPRAWRRRVAIEWGESGIAPALRIARCPYILKTWNAWAGGFHLRERSACVPLVFSVGRRSVTVRFGLGRRCGAH